MRTEPTLEEVVNGPRGILEGIEACLREECLLSAASLIFAGIDAISALTRPIAAPKTDSAVFMRWVDRFLLPGSRLPCNAVDLYAARCGLLHTYGYSSTRVASGEARPLVLQWAAGPPADSEIPLPESALVVHMEDLHESLVRAVHDFVIASETDTEIAPRVQHHVKALACYKPASSLLLLPAA